MAIAKKDRFATRGLRLAICEDSNIFPPKQVEYNGLRLFCLGMSNKNTLVEEDMEEYHTAEKKGQFIYTSEVGDMYDLCMYADYTERVILTGIKTRLK